MRSDLKQIGIIGLGLIGASVAAAVKSKSSSVRISAYDTDRRALDHGLTIGIIDAAADSIRALAENSDLILLAVPVSAANECLSKLWEFKGIVTDVGSVKAPLLASAGRVFGDLSQVVPGHPIAGSEKQGVEAADPHLFSAHKVILTPSLETLPDAVALVSDLWKSLGAIVVIMDVKDHDRILAQTSHLPHLLAYTLVDLLAVDNEDLEVFQYAAGGFRDFSRIAASDARMWRDIFTTNKKELLVAVKSFRARLKAIEGLIEEDQFEELEQVLLRAKAARDYFSSINDIK
ncbi:MAG TPA: prephenate dehydrogenase/arogenate dehydrogenase family protein [Gammaproteobacteria bacterium]|mgnify:CR=1 FL=1|nr:prephenate dehydrogenase/arogenate dehydrogenase family protein [Gammaproteobacteria bacterium]HIK70197.1 prephenate dehydrogenase/arogenate dehydrogenase family protein [Pseudomonadales bacterium]